MMSTNNQYHVRPDGRFPSPTPVQQHKLLPLDYLAPRSWDSACLVFSVHDTATALGRLKTGLSLALADFRWLAGSLEADGDGSLSLMIRPQDSVALSITKLENFSSYSELRSAGFPQDAFDPSVLMPPGDWSIAAGSPTSNLDGAVKVAAFQANIIQQGLILSLTWHQSCCDAAGMFGFVRRWAQCARLSGTKPAPAQKLSESKKLASRPMRHRSDQTRMEKLSEKMAKRKYAQTQAVRGSGWSPGVYSAIIHFPRDKLATLLEKSTSSDSASDPKPQNPSMLASKKKILLHHAVLALVYKRVIEARWRTFHAGPAALTDISLALDLRRSPPYINIGFGSTVLNATSEPMAVRDILSDASLPLMAESICETCNGVTLSTVNEANEWIERMDRPCEATLKLDPAVSLNFAAVDYRAWRLDELDFGFQPPKVFRHGNPPMNGMAMLLPVRDDGLGLEVLVSLEQSSMRRLLDDWELKMYATPVLSGGSALARSFVGNDRGEGR